MKKAGYVLILLIILILFLTGCATIESGFYGVSNFFGVGQNQEVGGSGVILKFIEAPDNNEQIMEGQPVNVRIEIDNYVPGDNPLVGEVCMRDDFLDGGHYGGIPSSQCQRVNLPPASRNPSDNSVNPSREGFTFGPYVYSNIEKDFTLKTKITADLKYEVDAKALTTMCVKRPVAEGANIPSNCGKKQQLQIQQTDLPLKISSIEARAPSTSSLESSILLDITISKIKQGQVITKGNIISSQVNLAKADIDFQVLGNGMPLTCTGLSGGNLQFSQSENQKVIKCSLSRLSLNQNYIQVPITIKMGYGFIQSVDGPTIQLIKEEAIA